MALVLLPLVVAPAGPWNVGWGFQTTRLPPLPPHMQSYLLNRSVLGLFLGNNTGMDSSEEVVAEARLGVVGIGWNLNHIATSTNGQDPRTAGGGLERYELEQAAALKAARPEMGVMVLRNTEVVSVFWDAGKKAMLDPSLWLQTPPGSGVAHAEPWGTDDARSGGPTVKYFLNFSQPRARAWWLNEYVAPALDAPGVDGVFTDCSCGTARGERFTFEEAAGRQSAFDAAFDAARRSELGREAAERGGAAAGGRAECARVRRVCGGGGFSGRGAAVRAWPPRAVPTLDASLGAQRASGSPCNRHVTTTM